LGIRGSETLGASIFEERAMPIDLEIVKEALANWKHEPAEPEKPVGRKFIVIPFHGSNVRREVIRTSLGCNDKTTAAKSDS
jgi:hypothetical protein